MKKMNGLSVVMLAAGLANCSSMDSTMNAKADSMTAELAHCYNVNKCKGHNDCKTAKNACGGHASCKGTGFVGMPVKACKDVGGVVKDDWRGKINTADLVHCYDVNVCKGHNDCKTAKNACGGQASCKGTGFVNTTKKSCEDIGGKVKS